MEGEGSPLKFWPILIKFRMLTVCYIPGLHTKFHQNRPKKKEVEKSGGPPRKFRPQNKYVAHHFMLITFPGEQLISQQHFVKNEVAVLEL